MHSTRERILETGAELFRRQGLTGTGLKQVVAEADAPFGSLYHHFPGGKDQLAAEVIGRAGDWYGQLFLDVVGDEPDVVSGVRAFFSGAAATVRDSGYADACPIAVVALEVASTNEPLREATQEVFAGWVDAGSAWLSAAGIPAAEARALTLTMVAALEGAFLLSRAARSTEAIDAAGEAMAGLVERALAAPTA